MFFDREGRRRTKIKPGDRAVFHLDDGALSFHRDHRWTQRHSKLYFHYHVDKIMIGRGITKNTAQFIMNVICECHDFYFEEEYYSDTPGGSFVRYLIKGKQCPRVHTARIQNTSSERLLLYTTVAERQFIQMILDRSRASNNSELMRRAFQQYLILHKRVQQGDEIIVRSNGGIGQRSLFIPLEWKDRAYRDIKEIKKIAARKLLEIRLKPEFKAQLVKFVAAGYAPSLTALAGASLQVYASVLAAQEEHAAILAKDRKGNEIPLLQK